MDFKKLTVPQILAIVGFLQQGILAGIQAVKGKEATPEQLAALWADYDTAHAAAMDAKATF